MIHGTPTASRNASMFTGNFILFSVFFVNIIFFIFLKKTIVFNN